ncbi:hypothetical protein C2857_003376 [Epichloe festucae Fl1]|uniref:UDP-glucose:glycoprotein glucosyltransferase n=1 Tax=Epichloe festucae (strain Fl1) TaxID=877507 RepID=A0A7S9KK89_EPIFF|nr:hypothetical protein C2857_003376 [Epichloe festucae Fl1]
MYLDLEPWPLLVWLTFALQIVTAVPAVRIGMTAAFDAGPYLLELVETAAGENSSSYFPILDRIASGHFNNASTDFDLYDQFVEVLRHDGHITDPDAFSTFNLALSLRSAAPRIEAHYQHYRTAIEPFVEHRNCDVWVLFDRKQYCTPDLDTIVKDDLFSSVVKTLPFDRTLGSGKEAILFADPTSPTFAKYHQSLLKDARALALRYRVRYRRDNANSNRPLQIGGYGVQLALKKTDYIVIDDRHVEKNLDQKPLSSQKVLEDEDEETTDLEPLSTTDLLSVGMKAGSFIQQSEDPFDMLVKLSQDFPKYASFISSHNISNNFAEEHGNNKAHMMRDGVNSLWMNGAQLIDRQIDPFTLVDILRRERRLVKGIRELGFDGASAVALLGHKAVSSARDEEELPRYDWTDRPEREQVILWFNDLEKDDTYESYPKALSSLLQRTYPGQIPPIGLNVFNMIFTADLTNVEDLHFISQVISIMKRGIPIRFGLVPLITTNIAASQAKVAYFLTRNYGIGTFLSYIEQLTLKDGVYDESLLLSVTNGRSVLSNGYPMSTDAIWTAAEFDEQLQLTGKWITRLQADTVVRPLFVNGVAIYRDQNWMQTMSITIGNDLQTVQRGLYYGILNDGSSALEMFLSEAKLKRNLYTLQDNEKSLRMLNVANIYDDNAAFSAALPVLNADKNTTREEWATITVLANMSSIAGLGLTLSALDFKRQNPAVRIDLINTHGDFSASSQVNAALKKRENELLNVLSVDDLQSIISGASNFDAADFYAEGVTSILSDAKLMPGSEGVIINGRVIGPIRPEVPLSSDDLQDLLAFERTYRILPVYSAIEDLGLTDAISGPIAAAKLSSIVALSTISDLPEGIFESAPAARSTLYDTWNTSHTAIQTGDPKTASIHIVGLLDPASEKAQRWAPILKAVSKLDGIYVKLIMNPREKVEELPVKRFFRYVVESRPIFEEDGSLKTLQATFAGLPSNLLMTAGLDVPPAWLVAPKSSVHDLDNIKLNAVKSDVEATYQLQHILIEGHSRESTGSAPRGAQLVLATETQPLITDTIIMANLGYFQFKANPGLYNIHLKEGRSQEIYSIESVGAHGWEPVAGDEGTELVLMDFQGTTVYPRLKRHPGMEKHDVLEKIGQDSDTNLLTKGLKLAEGLLGNLKGKPLSGPQHADINIFSVASGHLYERMLSIMIVSVMRNTKRSVKFWFIEQFLSPSFKHFIPHLAEAYGFSYEMVTYKWPHWLRQQQEKQREIWGYKILFLDVLFPLSLDKVIFVDADQIVRTDMMDLVNLDLNGAPYGFTPMCDSRTDMEGFRFWKQGYWANYLRGKPYHISALYVVDLRRFRELAAGDRLRQQYHALSADPASLSNLDQDLPNHMQFQIPIHSLPQEWLWCETWCSDDSLKQARTIDLCNNPLTKEPKLDRARRQVPEWTSYDEEIAIIEAKQGLNRAPDPLAEKAPRKADAGQVERAARGPDQRHQKDEL